MNKSQVASSGQRGTQVQKAGIFARLVQFFREIFTELKKVQRPTQHELGEIFLTVVIFVAVVMLFVGLLDAGFAKLTFWIFG